MKLAAFVVASLVMSVSPSLAHGGGGGGGGGHSAGAAGGIPGLGAILKQIQANGGLKGVDLSKLGIPNTPGAAGTTGHAAGAGVSGTPGASATPGISGTPGVCATPGVSGTAGVSATPGVSGSLPTNVTNAIQNATGINSATANSLYHQWQSKGTISGAAGSSAAGTTGGATTPVSVSPAVSSEISKLQNSLLTPKGFSASSSSAAGQSMDEYMKSFGLQPPSALGGSTAGAESWDSIFNTK